MNFFETVAGHEFTQGTIPRLIESMDTLATVIDNFNKIQNRQQYIKRFDHTSDLQTYLDKGARVVSITYDTACNQYIAVLEE